MARSITFPREQNYTRRIYNGIEVVWVPEVNAQFSHGSGKSRRGRAILDTGSPWCAMPKDVAAHLGVDLASCAHQKTAGVTGEGEVPYVLLTVSALGVEAECKVLLLTSPNLYLVGRVPFFSAFDFAFCEEADGRQSRILYRQK